MTVLALWELQESVLSLTKQVQQLVALAQRPQLLKWSGTPHGTSWTNFK